jgi:hypothetical protein
MDGLTRSRSLKRGYCVPVTQICLVAFRWEMVGVYSLLVSSGWDTKAVVTYKVCCSIHGCSRYHIHFGSLVKSRCSSSRERLQGIRVAAEAAALTRVHRVRIIQ